MAVSKKKAIVWILVTALVACSVAAAKIIHDQRQLDMKRKQPDMDRMLRDLYDVDAKDPDLRITVNGKPIQVKLWLDKGFDFGLKSLNVKGDENYKHRVAFLEVHELDPKTRQPLGNEVSPQLDAVTYEKRGEFWELLSTQRAMLPANRLSSFSESQDTLQYLPLNPSNVTFGFGRRARRDPEELVFMDLFSFSNGLWSYAGSLPNAGHVCSPYTRDCGDFKAKFNIDISDKPGVMPDISADMAGQMLVAGELAPVKRITYRFKNGLYESDAPDEKLGDVRTKIVLTGRYLQYPKNVHAGFIQKAFDSMTCQDWADDPTLKGCALNSSQSSELIHGLPGACSGDKEMSLWFRNQRLESVGCSLQLTAWRELFQSLLAKYGSPKLDGATVFAMRQESAEWRVGDDYIALVSFEGANIRGEPLANFEVKVSARPLSNKALQQ